MCEGLHDPLAQQMMQPPHPKSHALAVQAELQILVFDVVAGGGFPRFNCAQRRFHPSMWVAAVGCLCPPSRRGSRDP